MFLRHVDEVPLKINTDSKGMELISKIITEQVERCIVTSGSSSSHENPVTWNERLDSMIEDNPNHELVEVTGNDLKRTIDLDLNLKDGQRIIEKS